MIDRIDRAKDLLCPLFEAARAAGGEDPKLRDKDAALQAVQAVLIDRPFSELRQIAMLLRIRNASRWDSTERISQAIAPEIVRLSFRNDCFL